MGINKIKIKKNAPPLYCSDSFFYTLEEGRIDYKKYVELITEVELKKAVVLIGKFYSALSDKDLIDD